MEQSSRTIIGASNCIVIFNIAVWFDRYSANVNRSIDRARGARYISRDRFPFRERRFTSRHDKFRAHGPRSWLCNVIALEQLDCTYTCTFVNLLQLSLFSRVVMKSRSMESCHKCISRYETIDDFLLIFFILHFFDGYLMDVVSIAVDCY